MTNEERAVRATLAAALLSAGTIRVFINEPASLSALKEATDKVYAALFPATPNAPPVGFANVPPL